MSTLDILTSIAHGTPEGVRQGCRSKTLCPSPVPCQTVALRYAGDYSFRRRIDEGMTAAGIIAAEAEEHRQAIAPSAPVTVRNVKVASGPSQRPRKCDRDELRRLHALGLNDPAIARELGVSDVTVGKIRRSLGLPRAVDPDTGEPPRATPAPRPSKHTDIVRLYHERLRDAEIAQRLHLNRTYVGWVRRQHGLPVHEAAA